MARRGLEQPNPALDNLWIIGLRQPVSNGRLDVVRPHALGRAHERAIAPDPCAGQVALQSDAAAIIRCGQAKNGIRLSELCGTAQRLLCLGTRYGLGSIEAPVEGSVLLVERKPCVWEIGSLPVRNSSSSSARCSSVA